MPVFGEVSVAWMVKLNVPPAVGVPVMAPVAGIERQAGRQRARDHRIAVGPVPPLALTVWL